MTRKHTTKHIIPQITRVVLIFLLEFTKTSTRAKIMYRRMAKDCSAYGEYIIVRAHAIEK